MTDETTTVTEVKTSSRTRKILLAALVLVVAVVLVGFLASRSGLDKALLKQQLDAFAVSIHEKGKKEGRDIQFTYREIDITGGLSDRHAVIYAPQLSIKPLAGDTRKVGPEDNLILRTEQVAIHPKAVDLSKVLVSLAHPIEFFDGTDEARKLLTIAAAVPFEASVAQHLANDRPYLEVQHTMPPRIDLTYLREQQAEGAEDQTPNIVPVYETLTLTQAPGGTIRSDLAQDGSGLGEVVVKLAELAIVPEVQPEGAIRIAAIDSSWSHRLNEKNHHVVDAKLRVGDITSVPEVLPYGPLALVLDATYEGAAPQTAQDLASIRTQESSIKLNRFALSAKDADLTVTADFVASATDILPVGTATVAMTNVPFVLGELRRYQLLDAQNEPLVADIVGLVTGTPMAELKDTTIDINRARGGSFAIGKTTFEELFAVVLKHTMTKRPATPQEPTVPAAPVEKIQVEEGARG